MTTTADLIHGARRWLQSSGRPEYNRLNGAMTNVATTGTLEFAMGSINSGAVLGIDLEEMYVWSIASLVATVQRGWNGSTAAAHNDDSVVEVNPLFSSWRIFNELNAELSSLSPQVYQVKTVSATATADSSYNLATDVLDILTVQYNDYTGADWPVLTRWALLTNQDTSVFASGKALRLYEMPAPGRTIRVTYAAPLSTLATITDTVETVSGIPAGAVDIPAIGAAARLLSSREARRSQVDAQPEPRQASEVPPGAARSAAAQLFALRDRRIKEESAKLSRLYPSRIRRAV